ncbi:MAG TPA: hypothetical protein VK816_04770 [Jatrophihabitantaceae bacterium]|nr:hypothetical protein [Jatrophihabitantaceae bacterium]
MLKSTPDGVGAGLVEAAVVVAGAMGEGDVATGRGAETVADGRATAAW